MRAFVAFFKKELLEYTRSGKLLILLILFTVFGIMNPAIAKLTPMIMELLSEEMGEIGMTVTEMRVDALTSWAQFFKNISTALIAFVLICGGAFVKEYSSGTLILMLTKGLSRYKVVLAKGLTMLSLWTVGYWLCFVITYGYTAYYWDNGIAVHLIPAVVFWWLFGVFAVALTVLFSVLTSSYSGVMLGTGAVVLVSYVLEFLPKAAKYTPTHLMSSGGLLTEAVKIEDFVPSVIIAVTLSALCFVAAVIAFNKKRL